MMPDIFKGVDYLHVFKDRKCLLKFDEEINGKTKKELQELIGEALGEGTFKYSLKYKNDAKNYRGSIRGFIKAGTIKESIKNDMNEKIILESINRLAESIAQTQTAKNDPEKIVNLTEKFYKTQMEFLTKQNEALEKKLDKLEKESAGNNGGLQEMLMMSILNGFNKPQAPAGAGLGGVVSSDEIPEQFKQVFNQVDFQKMPVEKINELAGQLNYIIKTLNLPMKG